MACRVPGGSWCWTSIMRPIPPGATLRAAPSPRLHRPLRLMAAHFGAVAPGVGGENIVVEAAGRWRVGTGSARAHTGPGRGARAGRAQVAAPASRHLVPARPRPGGGAMLRWPSTWSSWTPACGASSSAPRRAPRRRRSASAMRFINYVVSPSSSLIGYQTVSSGSRQETQVRRGSRDLASPWWLLAGGIATGRRRR